MQVIGSPAKAVEIVELAESGDTLIGKGSGPVPEAPPCDAEGCLGRLGSESFLEPQVFTHAVRVKVDRETGVVRVLQVAAPSTTRARSSTASARPARCSAAS